MSRVAIPFHLRPNKHIDRRLFVESLRILSKIPEQDVKDYGYISMAGAFLEDMRFMYTDLSIDKLLSIERKARAFTRQLFNCPFPFIRCLRYSVNEMIDHYDECLEELGNPDNVIVWLDYEDTKRADQLAEVRELATILGRYDVVRVTMNASLESIDSIKVPETAAPFAQTEEDDPPSEDDVKRRERVVKLTHQLGQFAPSMTTEEMTHDGLAMILCQSIYEALKDGVGEGLEVQTVANFSYSDNQQMITVTATLWPVDKVDELLLTTGLRDWPFFSDSSSAITQIAVPALSLRERIEMDRIVTITDGAVVASASDDSESALVGVPQVNAVGEGAEQLEGPAVTADVTDEAADHPTDDPSDEPAPLVTDVFGDDDFAQYRRFQRYYPVFARVAV